MVSKSTPRLGDVSFMSSTSSLGSVSKEGPCHDISEPRARGAKHSRARTAVVVVVSSVRNWIPPEVGTPKCSICPTRCFFAKVVVNSSVVAPRAPRRRLLAKSCRMLRLDPVPIRGSTSETSKKPPYEIRNDIAETAR